MLLLARKDFVARLHAAMGDQLKDLPPAAGGMLPYIDLEGTRGTELARRMGVSKQAAGKAVRDLSNPVWSRACRTCRMHALSRFSSPPRDWNT